MDDQTVERLRAERREFDRFVAGWTWHLNPSDHRALWFHWVAWSNGEREPGCWEGVAKLLSKKMERASLGSRPLLERWREVLSLPLPMRFAAIFQPEAQQLWSTTPLGPLLPVRERHLALRIHRESKA